MREYAKKPLTVALAAVLVFMALFPVPVGARSLDRARFQEANANPVVAAPLIITTALAACGVYVAGYDVTAYANNQQTISGQFLQFCADNLYHEDIDAATAAIQSAATPGGAIDMSVLSSLGVLGLIPNFANSLVQSGDAVIGENTLAANQDVIYIGEYPFKTDSNLPIGYEEAANRMHQYNSSLEYFGHAQPRQIAMSSSLYRVETDLYFAQPNTAVFGIANTGENYSFKVSGGTRVYITVSVYSDGRNNAYSGINSFSGGFGKTFSLYPGFPIVSNTHSVSNGVVQSAAAVVTSAIVSGAAAMPMTTVQPFEPTAEQLAAGYDTSAILEAINSNTGTIEGVAAQLGSIAGLLSPVAGIAANVQSIKDAWTTTMTAQATPFPWLNSLLSPITAGVQAVQSWIGSTPFPTIMQTVLDGVQAIPDGIRNLGDDLTGSLEGVLDGVLSIPGTLEGVLDGVLEGVQAIPGSIAQVIEAVQAGVVDLTGALDAVMHPQLPNIQFDGVSLALPTGLSDEVELNLRDKVPFCYVIRARDAIGNMAGNLGYVQTRGMMTSQSSSGGSFRFGIEIPYAGLVEFDGGSVLSQPFGMYDIGTTIRILVTALLCFGLLMRAWKTAERTFGGM